MKQKILTAAIFLLYGNIVAQQPKKYTYTTEYTTTYIDCHSLYDRYLYESAYLNNGWKEYSESHTYVTNGTHFSSQDHYEIWVTFVRTDSILVKPKPVSK